MELDERLHIVGRKGTGSERRLDPVNEQINKSEVGDHRSVGIPGNIPNPAVKRVSADGTWRAASWESKKLPTSLFCFKRQWSGRYRPTENSLII